MISDLERKRGKIDRIRVDSMIPSFHARNETAARAMYMHTKRPHTIVFSFFLLYHLFTRLT